ncbi:hypothetical protein SNE40_020007 [Patella caerulea]
MSEFIVPSLKIFLDVLLNRELWKVALGQALIQAARPRSVIAPLLFGLGVELDHIFGSKWVVSQLYSLGFCISADEVALFKNSILQDEEQYSLSTSEEIDSQVMDNETPCYQFVADNADANIVTLDATGTFHGTGLIRWIKRGMVKSKPKSQVLRRARLQVFELCKKGGIQTRTYYRSAIPALSQLKLSPLLEIQIPHIVNSSEFYTTLLWRSSELLRKALQPAPNWINWSGYVEAASSKDTISVDDIHILPLLDLNPTDESTIFSLICYVDKQARQCKMPCTTITFDQPLYIKAVEVTAAIQCETVVVRLGGFHTLMNAVGAIFHLMRGSGIEEAMMEVYGENTVPHIMSGKAIARALRAINLLDSSLHIKLLEFLQPVEADATDNDDNIVPRLTEEQLTSLSNLLEKSLELSSEYDLDENPVLQTLASRLSLLQSTLSSTSRTAKLWIQFINYASCVKRFIYAERTKNWDAHLVGCSDFLNLFAATGHIHYAKSCRLYIQQMQALPHTHPWLYALYSEKGLHAVQRTEHPLNGLWSDLTIEQFLMASLKSRSGLTHGKGLSESVRYQWVHTMHHRAAIHDAMTTLTGRRRTSSNQHVELGTSRKHRDQADLAKFRQWLDNHNPFEPGIPVLRSLSTGITATEDINCDRAEEVGYKIQTSLDNKPCTEAKIKRKDQIRTLQDLLPGVRVGKKVIHVDPTTLFLRCVEVAKRLGSDFRAFFRYEMCSVPTSLFKDNCMLKTQKSALAAKLLVERDIDQLQTDFFVIDGGWLLHRITWKRNVTFNEILCQYSEFVRQRFACKCMIVMDGYVESNIKDHERLRRINGKVCGDVMVRLDTLNKYHQSNFLSNNTNKSRIVELLAARLSEDGHIVRKCSGDADITIANDALRLSSKGNNVQVVCNDTDVVCMLVYHVFQRGDNASGQIVLRKEPLPGKPKSGGLFCIQDICGKIHSRQAEALLFIHAWSGCDTTSSLFKHGKLELYNDIVKSERLVAIAEKMKSTDMSQTRIGDLGAEIFCRQFGDQNSNDLTTLRHTKFQMMITENLSKLDPRLLPPTPRASYYHSLRVHLQVVRWLQLDDCLLDEKEWGWEVGPHGLQPIMTDLPAAPEEVLTFVRCKCKRLNNRCGNHQCSCVKHGLKCVEACGGCHGRDCDNCPSGIPQEDDDDDDGDDVQ